MDKSAECGIDVSAKQLWVVLRRQGACEAERSFANTAAGHKELKRYLIRAAERVRICLESTGLYGLDVALYLQADPRLEVMVANPRAVKDFAKALLQRSKSDPLDAWVLAEYAGRMPFRAYSANTQASSGSLLLRCNSALAKSFTARGLATITSSLGSACKYKATLEPGRFQTNAHPLGGANEITFSSSLCPAAVVLAKLRSASHAPCRRNTTHNCFALTSMPHFCALVQGLLRELPRFRLPNPVSSPVELEHAGSWPPILLGL